VAATAPLDSSTGSGRQPSAKWNANQLEGVNGPSAAVGESGRKGALEMSYVLAQSLAQSCGDDCGEFSTGRLSVCTRMGSCWVPMIQAAGGPEPTRHPQTVGGGPDEIVAEGVAGAAN